MPILRGGRVLGVLVVQNRTPRHYAEEEIETLQTIATVLAELVAGGELVGDATSCEPAEGIGLLPMRLEGVRAQCRARHAAGVCCTSRASC